MPSSWWLLWVCFSNSPPVNGPVILSMPAIRHQCADYSTTKLRLADQKWWASQIKAKFILTEINLRPNEKNADYPIGRLHIVVIKVISVLLLVLIMIDSYLCLLRMFLCRLSVLLRLPSSAASVVDRISIVAGPVCSITSHKKSIDLLLLSDQFCRD